MATFVDEMFGGIIGYLRALSNFKVYNCINGINALATTEGFDGACAAGIVGFMYSPVRIYNCINLGTVKSTYAGRTCW